MGTPNMPGFTDTVTFDHIAREWRCKWDSENKACLDELQAALDGQLAAIKGIDGVVSVQRVVCGSCYDWKCIVKCTAAAFDSAMEGPLKAQEEAFLEKIGAITGVSNVETQAFTLEEQYKLST